MKQTPYGLAVMLLALGGCGKEAGRVPFAGEGSGEVTLPLKAGDVAFWTDIDIKYEGDASLAYQIELVQNGSAVGSATCNPLASLNVKTSWVEVNNGSAHSRRGNGKMACAIALAKDGPTTVKAKLAFARKPASVALPKADLVVKQ